MVRYTAPCLVALGVIALASSSGQTTAFAEEAAPSAVVVVAEDGAQQETSAEIPTEAKAAEPAPSAVQGNLDALWTVVAAILVFFMQAGFAMVETGFTRAKNACNIMMKNLLDFCIGSLAFWMIGFGLMFGATSTGFFGLNNFFFDKIRIDDPVGAISVHGVCGAWGTLAIGLFGKEVGLFFGGGLSQLVTQATGVGAAFLWAFPVSFLIFTAIKATVGLRVSEQEEMEGLDIHEHGMRAYPAGFISETPPGVPASPSTVFGPVAGLSATQTVPATSSVSAGS